jgi:type IV pilus assembly protein PilW
MKTTAFVHAISKPVKRSQGGLSLVELMVAITIGMLVIAALLALYLNITRTNTEMARANRQIENGRFAMQLLEQDIVHAGFWGEYVPPFDDLTASVTSEAPTGLPDPCLKIEDWDDDANAALATYKSNLIAIPVQAYSNAPPSGDGCVTDFAANQQPGTDVLVVRHAEPIAPIPVSACPSGQVCFQTSNCPLEINGTPPKPYVWGTAGFNLRQRDCGAAATVRRVVSNIYFVRDFSTVPGDGIPTLMRSEFRNGVYGVAQPLIEGIEGFKVEFGVDRLSESDGSVDYSEDIKWEDETKKLKALNRGDGIPDDDFVSAADLTCSGPADCEAANVVAVRIHILARSERPTPGYDSSGKEYCLGTIKPDGTCTNPIGSFDDGIKRHVFSTTVRLHNISGRRETP